MGESWPRSWVQTEHSGTHDQGQDSLIQAEYAELIRCLSYGANKNNLICLMWLVCTNWHFACEQQLLVEFNSAEVCLPSLLFFSSENLALP